MTFVLPWVLAGVPVGVWIVWRIGVVGVRRVPRRQHRWSMVVRSVALSLLVVAAAQPSIVSAVDDKTVFFLLDRSDSVGVESRTAQERIVNQAIELAGPTDRVGVGVFGAGLEVDTALTIGLESIRIGAVSEGSATDLETALRSAGSLLPSEGSRRIVVLSDLVETSGDARVAARELAADGVAVDVLPLAAARSADVLVESVRLPATVRTGDIATARVTVRSNQAGSGTLIVDPGNGSMIRREIDIVSGIQTVEVELPVSDPGALSVAVSIEADFDTRDENNRAEGVSRVLGPASIAVVEAVDGEAEALVGALEAGGLTVERVGSVPDDGGLLAFDAVVLVNVPKPDNATAGRLVAFVEDLGRALLVIGGDQSYGLGDYHETPLESILPVSSNPDDLIRRQPVAQVLVIDTSGSMGRCHCNNGQFDETGPNKTDISRAGAALAIDALSDTDTVGVLSFSSGYDWVIPLGAKPDESTVDEALGGLVPNGDTEIGVALEAALEELEGVPDALRHIVLFTDGWDPNDANLVPISRRIADAGVTLSVLGTGEGPGTTLQRMADVGGGRFYPGTDLSSVPEIFVEETLTVARNLVTEGSFFPALGVPSATTDALSSTPPLFGYVLTKSKSTAAVNLEIGQADPLLATWQRGLGRVTAWTSDASSRWSSGWIGWEGYVSFWGTAVRETLPAGRERPPEVFVEDGMVRIVASATGMGDAASAIARIRTPDGETGVIPMVRTSAGAFSAEAPAAVPGAYWAAVTVEDGSGGSITSGSGAVSSYEEEFAFREPDPTLGSDLAAITEGRYEPDVGSLFDAAPALGRIERPVWPLLALIGLLAFLADVALRRLVLIEGDAEEWRRGMTSETRRERTRVAEVEAQRAETKEKAVASESETLARLMRRKR
ncbi:MAG TPA: VWA domain-containing protein [Acidimicrobiia bacterium]